MGVVKKAHLLHLIAIIPHKSILRNVLIGVTQRKEHLSDQDIRQDNHPPSVGEAISLPRGTTQQNGIGSGEFVQIANIIQCRGRRNRLSDILWNSGSERLF